MAYPVPWLPHLPALNRCISLLKGRADVPGAALRIAGTWYYCATAQ
jgi:hypothetical protein